VLLISQFPTGACCAYVRHVERSLHTRTASTRQKLKKISWQKAQNWATIAAESRSHTHSTHSGMPTHTKIILPWYTTPFAGLLDYKFMMRGLVTRIKHMRHSHLVFNALFYTRQFQLYLLYEGPRGFAT